MEILSEGIVEIGKTSALQIHVGDRLFRDGTQQGGEQDGGGAGRRRRRRLGRRHPERHGVHEARRGDAVRNVIGKLRAAVVALAGSGSCRPLAARRPA